MAAEWDTGVGSDMVQVRVVRFSGCFCFLAVFVVCGDLVNERFGRTIVEGSVEDIKDSWTDLF